MPVRPGRPEATARRVDTRVPATPARLAAALPPSRHPVVLEPAHVGGWFGGKTLASWDATVCERDLSVSEAAAYLDDLLRMDPDNRSEYLYSRFEAVSGGYRREIFTAEDARAAAAVLQMFHLGRALD